jgi:hypothetical protein
MLDLLATGDTDRVNAAVDTAIGAVIDGRHAAGS